MPKLIAARPADPSATTSTTLVMMGLGVVFTPGLSGQVLVIATGAGSTATAAVNFTTAGRFGTGTPPANGAAVTGTRFGPPNDVGLRAVGTGATNGAAFTIADIVVLNPGTTYWFDLALLTSNGADAASIVSVTFSLVEFQS
jgi:hypothetical protein